MTAVTAPRLTGVELDDLQDALSEDINDACQSEGPNASWWAWFVTHKGGEQRMVALVERIKRDAFLAGQTSVTPPAPRGESNA